MTSWTLFEPWGLGDLAIGLHTLRALHNRGYQTSVICDPAYLPWVQDLPFVSRAFECVAPWTRKENKYDPRLYRLRSWYQLSQRLGGLGNTELFELRSDPRNFLFLRTLKILSGNSVSTFRQVQPPNGFKNRYDRGASFLKQVGIATPDEQTQLRSVGPTKKIGFFMGAEWENRRVPPAVVERLLSKIKASRPELDLYLILPPGDSGVSAPASPISGSISQVTTEIRNWDAVVSTDTSWLHVAHLVGVPTFGIFGFLNHEEWLPPGSGSWVLPQALPAEARYQVKNRSIQPLAKIEVQDLVDRLLAWFDRHQTR